MAFSIAERILSAIADRASAIRRVDGYRSDAGMTVFLHESADALEALPCIELFARRKRHAASQTYGRTRWEMEVSVRASAEEVGEARGSVALALLADLESALLSGDLTLGGLAIDVRLDDETIDPRGDGLRVASAALHLSVVFDAGYGDPYA